MKGLARLTALGARGWLVEQALVVVERSSRQRLPGWPSGYAEDRERKYGETTLSFGTVEVSSQVDDHVVFRRDYGICRIQNVESRTTREIVRIKELSNVCPQISASACNQYLHFIQSIRPTAVSVQSDGWI